MQDLDAEIARLRAGLVTLTKRLDLGAEKVLAAKEAGAPNAAALEDFWVVLLAEYCVCYDRLATLEAISEREEAL